MLTYISGFVSLLSKLMIDLFMIFLIRRKYNILRMIGIINWRWRFMIAETVDLCLRNFYVFDVIHHLAVYKCFMPFLFIKNKLINSCHLCLIPRMEKHHTFPLFRTIHYYAKSFFWINLYYQFWRCIFNFHVIWLCGLHLASSRIT